MEKSVDVVVPVICFSVFCMNDAYDGDVTIGAAFWEVSQILGIGTR